MEPFCERSYLPSWAERASAAALVSARRSGSMERLHLLVGPLLRGLELSNLLIAGGAVRRALLMGEPSDEVQQARHHHHIRVR